ncbi:MAG: DUF1565 domain-containing protein [Pseudomonadota bacterium]
MRKEFSARPLLLLVPMLAAACSGSGGGGSGPIGVLVMDATYQSIAVSVGFDNEANNASAYLEFKESASADWQRGVDMIRPPAGPIADPQSSSGSTGVPMATRWVGSVFFLNPDTSYDIRVTSRDSSGNATGTAQDSVTTANWSWPEDTGRKFYVNGTTGIDTNDGSQDHPFKTIGKAASVATTAGDTVHIATGIYYEAVQVAGSGTEGAPISFVGDDPGVVIDGSTESPLADWTTPSDGVYSRAFASYNPVMLFVGDHVRMFKHASLSDLTNGTSWPDDYWNTDTITDGWAYEGEKLYLKLPEGTNPTGLTVHISRWNSSSSSYGSGYGILIGGQKWIQIRNLTFQYNYYGVKIKSNDNDAPNQYIRVADSTFWNNKLGIEATHVTAFNVYEDNKFYDTKVAEWPWNAHKVSPNETCAIAVGADANWVESHANVIRNNTVDGHANGICAHTKNTDIHDNMITNIADDAFEPDTAYGLTTSWAADQGNLFVTENLRFYNNRIDTVFDGISLAPIHGVTYIFGNTVTNFKVNAIKHDGNMNSYGPVLMWNNSFWSPYDRGSLGSTFVFKVGAEVWNHNFENNVAWAKDYGIYSLSDSSMSTAGNFFDYNLWYTMGSGFWDLPTASYSSLSAVQAAIPAWEQNGLEPTTDPTSTFENALGGDMSLKAGNPAIDKGRLIPGIHCAKPDSEDSGQKYCVHWNGSAPDIGAVQTL